ncbi:MAG: DUF4199 domain-containing protein [Bacteroidales bacterium]
MEEKSMTLNKNSMMTSISVGGAIVLVSIVLYIFDLDARGFWGYLIYAILLAGIIWGTKKFRDHYNNGLLTYGQGIKSGLLIGLYTGIINAVYTFLFFKYFAPEQISVVLQKYEEQILERTPDITDQQLDMALSMTEKFMTPGFMAFNSLIYTLLSALLLSLIVAIFMKRNVQKSIE